MGILNLGEIRTEVISSMGTRPNLTNARVDVWINLAYFDIASGVHFVELDGVLVIATVVGQNNYTGPVNPLIVELLRDDTNDVLLTWVPNNEYFRLDRSIANAKPLKWTRRGTEVLVHPNPDAIISMSSFFKITPTKLVADGDLTILPPYTDSGLIFLATAHGLMSVGEDQRGTLWANRAVNYMSSRLTDEDFSYLIGGLSNQPTSADGARGATSGLRDTGRV